MGEGREYEGRVITRDDRRLVARCGEKVSGAGAGGISGK